MASPPDLPGKDEVNYSQADARRGARKAREREDGEDDPAKIELSPSETTVAFDPILPLLRVPVPAGSNDEPEKGRYILAFRDEDAWQHAWSSTEAKLIGQCETGARMGCSVNASRACAPPWWKKLLPGGSGLSVEEEEKQREACEEKEMIACLALAKGKCAELARESCEPVFRHMRIAANPGAVHPRFMDTRMRTAMLAAQGVTLVRPEPSPSSTSKHGRSKSLTLSSWPQVAASAEVAVLEAPGTGVGLGEGHFPGSRPGTKYPVSPSGGSKQTHLGRGRGEGRNTRQQLHQQGGAEQGGPGSSAKRDAVLGDVHTNLREALAANARSAASEREEARDDAVPCNNGLAMSPDASIAPRPTLQGSYSITSKWLPRRQQPFGSPGPVQIGSGLGDQKAGGQFGSHGDGASEGWVGGLIRPKAHSMHSPPGTLSAGAGAHGDPVMSQGGNGEQQHQSTPGSNSAVDLAKGIWHKVETQIAERVRSWKPS